MFSNVSWRFLSRLSSGEAGISLVEVMVSITVLAVTMAAVASTTIQSLAVARDSRESIAAANVAQFELERLRSIPFVDWVVTARQDGGNATTVTMDKELDNGAAYTISREVVWVSSGADSDGCATAIDGEGGGSDYVRVTQTVEFPDRDIEPVTNTTIITPRLDFFDPDTGNLAVQVRDRDGVGAAGHLVEVRGLAGTEVTATDRNGCAFFPFLTVDATTPANNGYTISIHTPDHIDLGTQMPEIADIQYLQAQQTLVAEFQYPAHAEIDVRPDLPAVPLVAAVGDRRPAGGCVITVTGNVMECLAPDGTPRPVLGDGTSWRATIPEDLGYSLDNGTLGHRAWPSPTPDTDQAVDVRPTVLSPVYPFAAGYSAFAGRCRGSDPQATGAPNGLLLPSEPGQTTDAHIEMATVTMFTGDMAIDVLDLDGDGSVTDPIVDSQPGRDVWAEMRDDATCSEGDRIYLGRSDSNGRLTTVLPFGTWYLYSRSQGAGGVVASPLTGGPHSCSGGTPLAPGPCVDIRADYRIDQTPLAAPCVGPQVLGTSGGNVINTSCGSTTDPVYGYVFVPEHR